MWVASLPLWALAGGFAIATISLTIESGKSGAASDAGSVILGAIITSAFSILAVLVWRL